MKKIYSLVLTFFSISGMVGFAMAQTTGSTDLPSIVPSATFISVVGVVTVHDAKGKSRKVTTGEKAFEGERIAVATESRTTLRLFDGSTLDLASHSQLVLKTLQQPSEKEKRIGFHLDFGMVLAKVKKLMTASSTFEVEAGGSVCGVRGTEFSFSYDPDKNKIILEVREGTVYFKSAGNTSLYHAGERVEFINGRPASGTTGGGGATLLYKGGFRVAGGSMGSTGGILGGWSGGISLAGGTGAALADLNGQFTAGILVNHNNVLNNTTTAVGTKIITHVTLPSLGALP